MNLSVNGKPKSYDKSDILVSELLAFEDVETAEMVTVQVNGKFVGQHSYEDTQVHEGDEVQYLYYMGGGSSHFRPPPCISRPPVSGRSEWQTPTRWS